MTIDGVEQDVTVSIFQPIEYETEKWGCDYQIEWPVRAKRKTIYGVDSMQALVLAMYLVPIELYISEPHKQGNLKWLEQGEGYGFPLSQSFSDLAEGRDRSL
jgi:hypothetical protein